MYLRHTIILVDPFFTHRAYLWHADYSRLTFFYPQGVPTARGLFSFDILLPIGRTSGTWIIFADLFLFIPERYSTPSGLFSTLYDSPAFHTGLCRFNPFRIGDVFLPIGRTYGTRIVFVDLYAKASHFIRGDADSIPSGLGTFFYLKNLFYLLIPFTAVVNGIQYRNRT